MRYPSCFVLVTAETEAELVRIHGSAFSQSLNSTPPPATSTAASYGPPTSSPVTPGPGSVLGGSQHPTPGDTKVPPPLLEYNEVFEPIIDPEGSCAIGNRIFEKVWQDCTITSGQQQQQQHRSVILSS